MVTSGERERGGQDKGRGLRGTNYCVQNNKLQGYTVKHSKYNPYFTIT